MEKKLSRADYVEFRYLNGKNVRTVKGWVDKITRESIYVGNEYMIDKEGLIIEHTKRYRISKMENLTKNPKDF